MSMSILWKYAHTWKSLCDWGLNVIILANILHFITIDAPIHNSYKNFLCFNKQLILCIFFKLFDILHALLNPAACAVCTHMWYVFFGLCIACDTAHLNDFS